MGSRIRRSTALIAGAVALAALSGASSAANEVGSDSQPAVHSSATVSFQPRRGAATPGLDQALAEIASTARRRGAAAGARSARGQALETVGNSVRLVVEGGAGAAAAVRSHGGHVEARSGRLLEALVPAAALSSLAHSAAVDEVRRPLLARPQATYNEAVTLMNAGRAHAAGTLGAGVKVAVIDGGFDGLAASQARGDLPQTLTTQSFCAGSNSDHGTAVAENVYHVAPAASLYLLCIDTEVDLANAVAYAKAQGVAIIVHSIGWYNTGRGDGSGAAGMPDAIVADARANGILWVNAAGNDAETHWQASSFVDSGTNGFFDFTPGDELNDFIVGSGRSACVTLKWDAWPTTTQDYDLYVFRSDNLSTPYEKSIRDQSVGADPYEELCFTNSTGATRAFGFAIDKFDATNTSLRFDAFVLDVGDIEYPIAAGSVVEPASSPNAVAVGAVCWNGLVIQPFSGRGPTIDARTKPDLVAPDATSSGVYGDTGTCLDGFAGTSGAAPHVAGLAALLKSADPSLTVAQLEASLKSKALDVGTTGADSSYGAGLAWFPSAAVVADGNGARLAFTRGNSLTRDLWTTLLNGTDAHNYTFNTGDDERYPVWSPDGSRIAFVNTNVSVMSANGSGGRGFTAGTTPAWSHDGSRIAALGSISLYVVPAVGGQAVDLGNIFVSTGNVSWSPDDSKLYGVFGGDVYTVNADGTNKALVAATPAVEEWIALSPDGTKIAYTADTGGGDQHVYVIPSNLSGVPLQLTNEPGVEELEPRWSPDGSTILYTRRPDGCCSGGQVWRVAADGSSAPQAVTTGAEFEWNADWEPLVTPFALELPFTTGNAVVDQWLSSRRTFGGTDPISLAYDWLRCNSAGAACVTTGATTGSTYQVTAADLGSTLRLAVTATNAAGAVTATSLPTKAVTAPSSGGGGGGGGGGVGPDIQVSLASSNAAPAPNEVVEIRASVFNDSPNLAARDLLATIGLPSGTTLLGSPAFTTGSGCGGSPTMVCNLDYLSPKNTSVVRFSLNVGAAGPKAITLSTAMSVGDPNLANNAGSLTLDVKAPAAPTPPRVTPPAAAKSFTGTNRANVLRGTAGPNVMRGLGGNDRIFGNGGNDRLFGGAGNDWLVGGAGLDVLVGGTGNDTLQARDGKRDTLACGPGRDLAVADRVDKVARSCETVRRR